MRSTIAVLVTVLGLLPVPLRAADAATARGKFEFQFRLRGEHVDDAALARDAAATTLRSRLTWTRDVPEGWQVAIEVDDVRALDRDAYYSTVDGPATRPVVADPVGTDLNRAVIARKRSGYDLALGRQRLTIDDQRFIGNVGWRQNEQTYDGATLRLRPLPKTELTLAWIRNVNRIYGPDTGTQAAHWHGNSWVLHGKRDLGALGTIAGFWYGMAFDDSPATSNATAGLSWRGKAPLAGGWVLPWAVAFASQRDYGRNPVDYSAGYRLVELGVGRGAVTVRLGQELLAGDAIRAGHRFQTPLATLHAFQGWADKFLTTPVAGVDDRYAALEAEWRGFKAVVAFHNFGAEALSRDYGSEWNVSVSRRVAGRYELLGKFADYAADGYAGDTTKGWLMLTATY